MRPCYHPAFILIMELAQSMDSEDKNIKLSLSANPPPLVRFIDFIVFAAFLYFGAKYYQIDHMMFNVIGLTTMAYLAVRKPDINTLSLISILLIASLIPAIVIYGHGQLGGYGLYSMLFLVNSLGVLIIWSRPFILMRFGPQWIKKYAGNLNSSRQDQAMGLLFSLQALWQLCQFMEHLTRHRSDIGLAGTFGDWKPLMFYNMYQTGQFGFAILTFLILYFMTFEHSKRDRNTNS